jgi:hypothetical protein
LADALRVVAVKLPNAISKAKGYEAVKVGM